MRRLVRIAAFPAVWLGGIVGAWAMLRAGVGPLVVAAAIGTATLAIVTLLEWRLPYRRAWRPRWSDLRVDGASFAVTAWGITALRGWMTPALVVVAVDFADLAHLPAWPVTWPVAVQVALAVAVSQLVSYGWHRLHHAVPLLWRFHAFHHSADRLYWLNAARTHPVEDLGSQVLGGLATLALGAPDDVLVLAGVALASFGPFQHCNADLAWGWLDAIFATGRVHRWHHSTVPAEANCNYGSCLLLWDFVFRTYRRFDGDGPAQLGTGGARAFPETYVGQLVAPVAWRRDYASGLREVGE